MSVPSPRDYPAELHPVLASGAAALNALRALLINLAAIDPDILAAHAGAIMSGLDDLEQSLNVVAARADALGNALARTRAN